jgi:hypothetical protein
VQQIAQVPYEGLNKCNGACLSISCAYQLAVGMDRYDLIYVQHHKYGAGISSKEMHTAALVHLFDIREIW